jgi:hypothetical protein
MNIGKPWTREEDDRLMEEIGERKTMECIARDHGRTQKAIRMRMEGFVRRLHKDRRYPVSSLVEMFHLPEQEIRLILEQEPPPRLRQERPQEDIHKRLDGIEEILNKINKKLSRLVEKKK